MNYILTSLSKTLAAIKTNKTLFLLLFLLQIVFVGSIVSVTLIYQAKIMENALGIVEPLQNANYNSSAIEAGQPFSTELLGVYTSYRALISNVFTWLLITVLLYLLLDGSLWLLSHHLAGKKLSWKTLLFLWLRFSSLALSLFITFGLVSYFVLKSMVAMQVSVDTVAAAGKVLLYIFIALYLLLTIAFAFVAESSFKKMLHSFLRAITKKIMYLIPAALLIAAVLGGALYALYFTINYEEYFAYMVLCTLLLFILLVISRLFWIVIINEVTHEENNS